MSIRRKLFLAFVAAAALPLCAVGVLARLYLERARVEVEERFVASARQLMQMMRSSSGRQLSELRAAVRGVGDRALKLPTDDEPANLKFLQRDWQRLADPFEQKSHASKKSLERIQKEALAKVQVVERDELQTAEAVKEFRRRNPEVLGVKIVLAGSTLYSDLKKDFSYPGPVTAEEFDTDARMPFLVTAIDGRRFIVESIDQELTEFLVEIDPAGLTQVHFFMDTGRLFYLRPDGTAAHSNYAAHQYLEGVPLRALAVMLPPVGERAHVVVGDQDWLVFHAGSGEHDRWGFGNGAELVAVAPAATVYAPIVRFRAEVWGAALASILVAVWLSYFL